MAETTSQSNTPAALGKTSPMAAFPAPLLITACVLSVCIPLVIGSILLLIYRSYFSGQISGELAAWTGFANIAGGLLGPVITWSGVFAVVTTVYYNAKAVQQSAEFFAKESRSQKKYERRDRTFQMLQVWLSPEMLRVRMNGWQLLREARAFASAHQSNRIYLGRYRQGQESRQLRFHNLDAVYRFLANVSALLDAKMLDRKQVWILFGPIFERWMKYFPDLNHRIDEYDSPEDRETADLNDWYTKHVQPLIQQMEQLKNDFE